MLDECEDVPPNLWEEMIIPLVPTPTIEGQMQPIDDGMIFRDEAEFVTERLWVD
jgi:hypothetical protein